MEFRKVTDSFTVSPQIEPGDLREIASAGFTTVVNNRPDGEEDDQSSAASLLASALQERLHYRHIPVVGSAISDEDVSDFRAVLDEAYGPVFAFCRSGMRSMKLWALANAGRYSADEIIKLARRAGYDLEPMAPLLKKS
ncbi:TIGR01244 family sulfur transferase [Aquisalinus flavus]|uniref:TIGR01244 family protein n=1 Tax=Aquisalinus flavus TaxID=1526572 RepID=A0A8J2V5G3_9PROT|nr:TIGR01244 family sulfur transferase [Aquisalinus flavus]GGD07597.1 TIGR01244 family protein [Aquisalinus flavus]